MVKTERTGKALKNSLRMMNTAVPFLAGAVLAAGLFGQGGGIDTRTWTTADDHRNMMEQLGIKALRPGPSGNESAPNHANYDESKANPYPDLPDVLMLKNGKKVMSKGMWWNQRRPEIVEEFEREVVGRVPKVVPKVTWEVTKTVEAMVGTHAVIGRQMLGHVDNSSYPDVKVDIQMTVVIPANAKGPVLEPPPTRRLRRASLHLPYSMAMFAPS